MGRPTIQLDSGPSKGPEPPAMGSREQARDSPTRSHSGPSKGPEPPAMGSCEQARTPPHDLTRDPQRVPTPPRWARASKLALPHTISLGTLKGSRIC